MPSQPHQSRFTEHFNTTFDFARHLYIPTDTHTFPTTDPHTTTTTTEHHHPTIKEIPHHHAPPTTSTPPNRPQSRQAILCNIPEYPYSPSVYSPPPEQQLVQESPADSALYSPGVYAAIVEEVRRDGMAWGEGWMGEPEQGVWDRSGGVGETLKERGAVEMWFASIGGLLAGVARERDGGAGGVVCAGGEVLWDVEAGEVGGYEGDLEGFQSSGLGCQSPFESSMGMLTDNGVGSPSHIDNTQHSTYVSLPQHLSTTSTPTHRRSQTYLNDDYHPAIHWPLIAPNTPAANCNHTIDSAPLPTPEPPTYTPQNHRRRNAISAPAPPPLSRPSSSSTTLASEPSEPFNSPGHASALLECSALTDGQDEGLGDSEVLATLVRMESSEEKGEPACGMVGVEGGGDGGVGVWGKRRNAICGFPDGVVEVDDEDVDGNLVEGFDTFF